MTPDGGCAHDEGTDTSQGKATTLESNSLTKGRLLVPGFLARVQGCRERSDFSDQGHPPLGNRRIHRKSRARAIRDIHRSGIGGSIERVEPEDLASLAEIANRVGVTRSALQKYARGSSKVGKDFPRPVLNIASPRRELFSTFEVMKWMHIKHRAEVSSQSLELFRAISMTNRALVIAKAQKDDEVGHLVAQLTAIEASERKHA